MADFLHSAYQKPCDPGLLLPHFTSAIFLPIVLIPPCQWNVWLRSFIQRRGPFQTFRLPLPVWTYLPTTAFAIPDCNKRKHTFMIKKKTLFDQTEEYLQYSWVLLPW